MNVSVQKATVFIRSMRFWGTQLVSYPVLYQMHQLWPNCEITVVGTDPLHRHYETLPWVRRFVSAQGFAEQFKCVTPGTDLMVALHFVSERYGAVGILRRPKYRLGFANARFTDFIWTHRYKKDWSEYMALSNMRLLGELSPFDPETAAKNCIAALAVAPSTELPSGLVVMILGGGDGPYKRWPIESFLALCDVLKVQLSPDMRFGFVLGPDESAEAAVLQSLARSDIVIFENRPLGELCRLMFGARLVVANDCGPSHLAQLACVPYVTVLHEPNPEWFWDQSYTRYVTPRDDSLEISRVQVADVAHACAEAMAQVSKSLRVRRLKQLSPLHKNNG
jgi:ADP-heptose:LPS heptosyltransferase